MKKVTIFQGWYQLLQAMSFGVHRGFPPLSIFMFKGPQMAKDIGVIRQALVEVNVVRFVTPGRVLCSTQRSTSILRLFKHAYLAIGKFYHGQNKKRNKKQTMRQKNIDRSKYKVINLKHKDKALFECRDLQHSWVCHFLGPWTCQLIEVGIVENPENVGECLFTSKYRAWSTGYNSCCARGVIWSTQRPPTDDILSNIAIQSIKNVWTWQKKKRRQLNYSCFTRQIFIFFFETE